MENVKLKPTKGCFIFDKNIVCVDLISWAFSRI